MTVIAEAHATSTAAPERFFVRWADMATWPEWNSDTEWVRLDGPFAAGSTGELKPEGGPRVRFTIASVTDTAFVDVSHLVGARLVFDHAITPAAGGGSEIRVAISMSGPMGWFWRAALGKGLRGSAQRDLDRLVATAESDATVAG